MPRFLNARTLTMFTSLLLALAVPAFALAQQPWSYPSTKTVDTVDTYFGTEYPDPYRWLENTGDAEVEHWFRSQADLTNDVLATIPGRDDLIKEWTHFDEKDPPRYSSIRVRRDRYFYKKTVGGEDVGKLYLRSGNDGAETLLFDPTAYHHDKLSGKAVVQNFTPSLDGEHVLLAISSSGAEWSEIRVLRVVDRTLLEDRINASLGMFNWAPDSQSFLYDRGTTDDPKNVGVLQNRGIRLHRLGTPITSDIDVIGNLSHPQLRIGPVPATEAMVDPNCPDRLFARAFTVQREGRHFFCDADGLRTNDFHWQEIAGVQDNILSDLEVDGDYVYAITTTDAPRGRLVRTRLSKPDWINAEVVLKEREDVAVSLVRSKNFLYVVYSDGISGRLVKYELARGAQTDVTLPQQGDIDIRCPDWTSDLCHVEVRSWIRPETRYDYDAATDEFRKSSFHEERELPGLSELEVREIEVQSHDGVMVPLSIIHRRDLPRDGSNCCILEGYGAYGTSAKPRFDFPRISLAVRGAVVAIAHPRGGGEKGQAWHEAGKKSTKPNSWKDFIACAEFLVDQGYTSPSRLSGVGTSAGGVIISRAITSRPDLFKAAVCNVGFANAMRGEFEATGPFNIPEFGTVRDPAECRALFEMDGYMHVIKGTDYPAVLGVAGWNDPRVAAWQPGKFIAALQNASSSSRPKLLLINFDSGHFTEEKAVSFRSFANQAAFLLWQTGHPEFQRGE